MTLTSQNIIDAMRLGFDNYLTSDAAQKIVIQLGNETNDTKFLLAHIYALSLQMKVPPESIDVNMPVSDIPRVSRLFFEFDIMQLTFDVDDILHANYCDHGYIAPDIFPVILYPFSRIDNRHTILNWLRSVMIASKKFRTFEKG